MNIKRPITVFGIVGFAVLCAVVWIAKQWYDRCFGWSGIRWTKDRCDTRCDCARNSYPPWPNWRICDSWPGRCLRNQLGAHRPLSPSEASTPTKIGEGMSNMTTLVRLIHSMFFEPQAQSQFRSSFGKKPTMLSLIFLGFVAFSNPSEATSSSTICKAFNKLLGKRSGLTQYQLQGIAAGEGLFRIPDLDIDEDGVRDDVSLFCPGSGSLVPADPCILNVQLSSGAALKLEAPRLSLVRFQSRIYAVTSIIESEALIKHDIYSVDNAGINLICKK